MRAPPPELPLTETIHRLRSLAAASPDASGYFPAMYAYVTRAVQHRLVSGAFTDPARMARFTTAFADLYLEVAEDRAAAPRCWRASWDVATDPGLLIAQHLLLGINAHVNHDLPQAVVAVAEEAGDLPCLRPDFDAVNVLLAEAYQHVVRRLDRVARWTSEAAALGEGRLFNFSLRMRGTRPGERLSDCTASTRPSGFTTCRSSTGWSVPWPTS